MRQALARISEFRRIGVALAVVVAVAVSAASWGLAQDKPGASPDQASPPAQALSPADMFAKHGLIGTFAAPCGAPPSHQNPHVVHRAGNAGRVDRHVLAGDPAPTGAATIDSVTEQGTRLQVSQVGGGGRITYVIEIDRDRFRTVDSKQAYGTVLIADGRFAGSNAPTQCWSAARGIFTRTAS